MRLQNSVLKTLRISSTKALYDSTVFSANIYVGNQSATVPENNSNNICSETITDPNAHIADLD